MTSKGDLIVWVTAVHPVQMELLGVSLKLSAMYIDKRQIKLCRGVLLLQSTELKTYTTIIGENAINIGK